MDVTWLCSCAILGPIADRHALYLMCDDLSVTLQDVRERGVTPDEPVEEMWGITTAPNLAGRGRLGIYEPRHPLAI